MTPCLDTKCGVSYVDVASLLFVLKKAFDSLPHSRTTLIDVATISITFVTEERHVIAS